MISEVQKEIEGKNEANETDNTVMDTEVYENNAIDYINICLERQEDIINKIIYLNGQEYFNNYKLENITLDETIQRKIKDTLHMAFWDCFHEELNLKPPDYRKLISLLNELRVTFCNFVPNRNDIHQEIYDKIDVDMIKNMIANNAFEDENLYNLATYIISLIKRFQPPIMDEEVDTWEQGMLAQFKESFEYSDFLVTFFKSVFNMIENIIIYNKQLLENLDNINNFHKIGFL